MAKTINQLAMEIHRNAAEKGFWDKDRNTGEMLMLIVSEVSEALEADRKGKFANLKAFQNDMEGWPEDHFTKFQLEFKQCIKDSFEDELADACIRIFDLAYSKGIDLQWHIETKLRYNSTLEHMHCKK